MFDNLRQKSAEQAEFLSSEEDAPVVETAASRPRSMRLLLGLTPTQRFVLALMLFLNVTVLGCLALIAFEKITLPIF